MNRFALVRFLGGLFLGMVLGYAVGIALAPTEGGSSRARLRDEARALKADPRLLTDGVRSRVETAVEDGRRAAAEKRRELASEVGLDRDASIPSRGMPL